MMVIHITAVIQVILAVYSLIQYKKIEKHQGKIMYCHEKKSFLDAYKMIKKFAWVNILAVYFAFDFKYWYKQSPVDDIVNLIIGSLIILIMSSIISAFTLYMTTEIKHLSPDDAIGKQVLEINNEKERKKAHEFYIVEVIVGIVADVTLLIQTFNLHIIIGIIFILFNCFLYYFGMADVLQHENYNSEEYKAELKRK